MKFYESFLKENVNSFFKKEDPAIFLCAVDIISRRSGNLAPDSRAHMPSQFIQIISLQILRI